jgi:hypothetical protein
MKKIILLVVAMNGILALTAQRIVRVSKNEVFESLADACYFWNRKCANVIIDSKFTITRVSIDASMNIKEEAISKDQFKKEITSVFDIPVYDSTGTLIGKRKADCLQRANVALVSSSPTLAGKIGFRFEKEIDNEESIMDYYFVDTASFSVIERNDFKILPRILLETTFSNKDCIKRDFNTKQKNKVSVAYFNLERKYITDTPSHFIAAAEILIQSYIKDFTKAHYTQGVNSFTLFMDDYENDKWEIRPPLYDTLLIYQSDSSSNYQKQIIQSLRPSDEGLICFNFNKKLDPFEGAHYSGICYQVYTSGGLYLGLNQIFLEENDRNKYFTLQSLLLEQFMMRKYQ